MSKYNGGHGVFDEHCLRHCLPFSYQIPATLLHTYTLTSSYLTTHGTFQTLPEGRHFMVSFIHPSPDVWCCLHKVCMCVASFGTEIFSLRTKEKMNIAFFPHHHHSHVIIYTHICTTSGQRWSRNKTVTTDTTTQRGDDWGKWHSTHHGHWLVAFLQSCNPNAEKSSYPEDGGLIYSLK